MFGILVEPTKIVSKKKDRIHQGWSLGKPGHFVQWGKKGNKKGVAEFTEILKMCQKKKI